MYQFWYIVLWYIYYASLINEIFIINSMLKKTFIIQTTTFCSIESNHLNRKYGNERPGHF